MMVFFGQPSGKSEWMETVESQRHVEQTSGSSRRKGYGWQRFGSVDGRRKIYPQGMQCHGSGSPSLSAILVYCTLSGRGARRRHHKKRLRSAEPNPVKWKIMKEELDASRAGSQPRSPAVIMRLTASRNQRRPPGTKKRNGPGVRDRKTNRRHLKSF